MRRVVAVAVLTLVLATVALVPLRRACVQGAAPSPPRATTLERLEARGLASLVRPPVRVFYSAGAEARAAHLAALVGEMSRFYRLPDSTSSGFDLAVLSPIDWAAVGGGPYGLPGIRSPTVVLMPAEHATAIVYGHMLSARDSIPPELRRRIEAVCDQYEACASEVLDLVVLHEIGHLLEMRAPLGRPTVWFGEFLAWYYAYTFLADTHPALAARVRLMHEALAAGVSPVVPTLEAFESHLRDPRTFPGTPERGLREYARLQGLLVGRAAAVRAAGGANLAVAFEQAFPRRSTAPECAENRVCAAHARSTAEVLARLDSLAPGFRAWADSVGIRR